MSDENGNGKLSAKQRAFITEYMKHFNATKAAIAVGYAENSAHVRGSELVNNSKISDEIDRRLKERALSKEGVVQRLSELATVDLEDIFDFPGNLPIFNAEKARERGVLHLIESIKVTDKYVEIKFPDSLKALELIGKYHKLFVDRVAHEDPDGNPLKIVVEYMDYNPKTGKRLDDD